MRLRAVRTVLAIGLGVAAAYLLDPRSGDERRKQLTDVIDKARKAGARARVQAGP